MAAAMAVNQRIPLSLADSRAVSASGLVRARKRAPISAPLVGRSGVAVGLGWLGMRPKSFMTGESVKR